MRNEAKRRNKETATINETGQEDKTHKNPKEWKGPKKTIADMFDNTTGRNKSKDIGKKR